MIKYLLYLALPLKTVNELNTECYAALTMKKSLHQNQEALACNILSFFAKKLDKDCNIFKQEFLISEIKELEDLFENDFILALSKCFFKMILCEVSQFSKTFILLPQFYLSLSDPNLMMITEKLKENFGNLNYLYALDNLTFYHFYSLDNPTFYFEHIQLIINMFVSQLSQDNIDGIHEIFSLVYDLETVYEAKSIYKARKTRIITNKEMLFYIYFNDIEDFLNLNRFIKNLTDLLINDVKTYLALTITLNHNVIINEITSKIFNIYDRNQINNELLLQAIKDMITTASNSYVDIISHPGLEEYKKHMESNKKIHTLTIHQNRIWDSALYFKNVILLIYPDWKFSNELFYGVTNLCQLISNHIEYIICQLNEVSKNKKTKLRYSNCDLCSSLTQPFSFSYFYPLKFI